MIVQNYAIAHYYVALRVRSDVLLVRHHDDCDSALVEVLKNSHDLDTGSAVEVAGRLIGEQHLGIVDQRARNGHTLLLAAGELAGMMVLATGESDCCKHAIGSFAKLCM